MEQSSTTIKRKIFFLLITSLILRAAILMFAKYDPLFILSPRNFNGRGLLTSPSWLDFMIPLAVIVLLPFNHKIRHFRFSQLTKPFLTALLLIVTPVIAGTLLNNYLQKIFIDFAFNATLFFRYILFIITYIAINLFADALSGSIQKKLHRRIILTLFILATAVTQDLFGTAGTMYILVGIINSVGVTTVIFAIGMRKFYKSRPLETTLSVSIAGIIPLFFIYNVLSVSFFTIFIPALSFFVVAMVLYKNYRFKKQLIIGSIPFMLALFLNYGLPAVVPTDLSKELIENKTTGTFFTAKVNNITVKYKDPGLKNIAVQFAKVIDAANRISIKEFGVSPNVNELVINGIGMGGFHAEFPNRIVGTIISKTYLKNCSDSAFLNNPLLQADFPDPVNAILHEYSHLFGVVTYHKWWPGAEEEGWATYSATRLSKLLYSKIKYRNLWEPVYNFGKQADKITSQNLSGKSVVWSHPNEYGGFNLWYRLGEEYGLKKLYRLRWQNTNHTVRGSIIIKSDPVKANKVAKAFGKEKFLKYGQMPAKLFGEIYRMKDYLYLAKTTGIDTGRIKKLYNFMKDKVINPAIPLP